MSIRKPPLIAAGCLVAGICVGVAGAQIAVIVQRWFIVTGAFETPSGTSTAFFVSVEGPRSSTPPRVVMEIVDHAGAVVASRETTLQAGQTAVLRTSHVGILHARARVVESMATLFTSRRVVGSVEIKDTLTGDIRPSCTVHDPVPAGGGRN